MVMNTRRQWLLDCLTGGLVGGVVGALVAVNFIITIGIGYDVSLVEVFRENVLAGIVTTAILAAGPILGVAVARRIRRRRQSPLAQ